MLANLTNEIKENGQEKEMKKKINKYNVIKIYENFYFLI